MLDGITKRKKPLKQVGFKAGEAWIMLEAKRGDDLIMMLDLLQSRHIKSVTRRSHNG